MPDRASKRGRGGSTIGKESQRGASHAGHEQSLQFKPEPSGFAGRRHDSLSSVLPVQPQLVDRPFPQDPNLYIAPPGKMLLPPLPKAKGPYPLSSSSDKFRTSHACNTCRKAKAKCSGGMPCDKCRNEDKECVYGEGKRDKERKEMERILHQNRKMIQKRELLVSTLWTFASNLAPSKRKDLEEIMTSPMFSIEEDDYQLASIGSDRRESETQESMDHGEDEASAEVGSPGSLDVIKEDTNRDENTRAAGFMGKSSAVNWVQRAKRAAANNHRDEENGHGNVGSVLNESYTNSTYHAEPSSNITVETDEVNPFEWPTSTVAKALVDLYFEHVHIAFPILSRGDFYATFESYPKSRITREDHIWLSLANMVFAMGAIFAHMTHADFRGDERDHHVYYARARALGIDQRSLNKDPELQHTICLGVLGLYLLSADQLNRSWTVCGIAIRHAMALGLHVRSEAEELSDVDKEFRVRLWWSLYSLECVLDELTGRPSCILDRHISTPLPINVDEADFHRDRALYDNRTTLHEPGRGKARFAEAEIPTPVESSSPSKVSSQQSGSPLASPSSVSFTFPMTRLSVTSSTYFIYRTRLSIISHDVLSQLYSASLVKAKWSGVQDIIRQVDARLLQWKSSLPEEFDFSSRTLTRIEGYEVHRTSFAIFYNSSRMLLFRPCLCQGRRIERQSERSKSFDANAAITCIQSARNIIAALPNIEEPTSLYNITAWWDTIHYIIEAASVLMLELAYRAEHLPSQAEDILTDSKTAVMWLRAMSDQSIAARKGWEIFDNLLNLVAPKVGGDTNNMPKTAPEPPGWKKWSPEDAVRRIHGIEYKPEQQYYTADPNRMTDWVDQSTYATQEGYSAPASAPVDIYARENGLPANFLASSYPFHHIYGRYGQYSPLANMLYPTTTFPNTTSLPIESLGLIAPQAGTMELYNYGDISEFTENKYETSGAGEQDYDMTRYHSWGDDNAVGNHGRYVGGPS